LIGKRLTQLDKLFDVFRQLTSIFSPYFCIKKKLKMKIDTENYPHLKFQTIESEGLQIAATVETESNEEHPIYHPANILYYMIEGQFNLKMNYQLHIIPQGGLCLIRKYTYGTCFKTWGENQKGARMIAFVLQDEFIKDMLKNVTSDEIEEKGACSKLLCSKDSLTLLKLIFMEIRSWTRR